MSAPFDLKASISARRTRSALVCSQSRNDDHPAATSDYSFSVDGSFEPFTILICLQSRVEDQELIITVPGEYVGAILRLNGFVFAGKNISITKVKADPADPNSKENIIAMFTAFLARRYNTETKLLDLSALGSDPELKASQVFESASTTSKVFPALMKVLERQFETPALKHEAIQSVTLANNELSNISAVTTLAPTLPQLKNLDLSNNKIAKIADLGLWRTKFSSLTHLIVSNNPIETEEPDYATTLVMWYPRLRFLNTVQVRTEEEAAKATQVTDFPFPIRTPSFQDEGQVAENFIRTFFTGFDSDRPALAAHFYDERSDFSFALNTSAPRDPSGEGATAPQEWADYIKESRNLKKISHPKPRQERLYKGTDAVAAAFATLPPTRHPDLAVESRKWLIECQLQPGVPDPTGQSPGGVDGFLITIHSEYEELDTSTGQAKKKRSFDRTFIIGPGGPAGVRIVNDVLTVRAYGGIAAFEPEQATIADPAPAAIAPQLPNGLTTEVAEQMILKLQELTRMTIGYAKDCLEQVGWDFEKAQQAFESVKAGLPAEAFIQA